MPVIIVGADSALGQPLANALSTGGSEVRAFITDPEPAGRLRALGVKVAVGDVTDASHVGGAALNAFSAVVLADAATDDRERSFAESVESIVETWAEAVRESRITRVILVAGDDFDAGPLATAAPEFTKIDTEAEGLIDAIVAANEAATV